MLLAAGEAVTPELQAKMDLFNIQQENASLRARAALRQNLMIGGAVVIGIVVGTVAIIKGLSHR